MKLIASSDTASKSSPTGSLICRMVSEITALDLSISLLHLVVAMGLGITNAQRALSSVQVIFKGKYQASDVRSTHQRKRYLLLAYDFEEKLGESLTIPEYIVVIP